MKSTTWRQFSQWTNGRLIAGNPDQTISGISTDSRTIRTGEAFAALPGDRFDGHDFVAKAEVMNCTGIIVNREWASSQSAAWPHRAVLAVENTLTALQEIARNYRQQFDIPVVAITGSNGKTTTKDMTAKLLAKKFNVLATRGNRNNHIGLPLTLLDLAPDHDGLVVELGMNHLGEIDRLAEICAPEFGVITNVGPVHLEFLESVDNVYRAKLELASHVDTLLVNGDDVRLVNEAQKRGPQIITFGTSSGCDYRVTEIFSNGRPGQKFFVNGQPAEILLPGQHNVLNAAAAIAVADQLGLNWTEITEGLREISLSDFRSEVLQTGRFTILNDCYNANPTSMKSAITMLLDYPAKNRRVAVLGDMHELGDSSRDWHFQIGEFVARNNINRLIAIGKDAEFLSEGALQAGMTRDQIDHCDSVDAALEIVKSRLEPDDVILIKGSRSMHLEDLVRELVK